MHFINALFFFSELDEDPGRELAAFQSKLKLQQAMNGERNIYLTHTYSIFYFRSAKLLKAVKDMKLNDVKMYVRTSSAGIIPDIDQTDSIGKL